MLEGLLNRVLVDQRFDEFLVEFERTGLSNLISCVDGNDSWRWLNAFDKDITEALRVTCAQNDDIDVEFFGFQEYHQALFIKLIDEVGFLLTLKAEVALFMSLYRRRLEHAMAHDYQHAGVLT